LGCRTGLGDWVGLTLTLHPYLKLFLLKNYDEVRLLSAGGTQPNLNVQKIKELLIPLPPLAEQDRIVARADQLLTICDQLEAQLTAVRTERVSLLEAVFHEALQGATESSSKGVLFSSFPSDLAEGALEAPL